MGANQFLGLHREEISIEHGRRLDVGLRQRERRQLDGKPARLQDAAFDVLDAGLEMRMALGEVRPGVDDADEGLAGIISRRIAHLVHARALPERAKVVAREPTGGAQVFGSFPRHGGLVVSRFGSASMVIGKQPSRSWTAPTARPRRKPGQVFVLGLWNIPQSAPLSVWLPTPTHGPPGDARKVILRPPAIQR